MNRLSLLMVLLLLLIAAGLVNAQEDYQKWLEKDQKAYQSYLEEQDKAFLDFLKADWEAFEAMQGMQADIKPKPVDMPVAPEPEPEPEPEPLPQPEPEPEKEPKPCEETIPDKKPEPVDETAKEKIIHDFLDIPELPPEREEPAPPPPPVSAEKPKVKFDFFDEHYVVNKIENVRMNLSGRIDNNKIATAWEHLAKSDYKPALQQLQTHADRIRLNDWGRLTFYHAYAQKMFTRNTNDQLILDWFLLTKAGYQCKLCYQKNQVLLLVPPKQLLYEIPYIVLDGQKYYFIGFENKFRPGDKVYTYRGGYQSADQPLDFSLVVLPRISAEKKEKNLGFKYNGQDVSVKFDYATDVVKFLADYPQTELVIYFQSTPSRSFQESLIASLAPHVREMNELEATNFLLRFVQTAFSYETDDRQFGREKYLLPEETIYYPGSDCEDRSILFAFLVKRLIGSKIVVLDYPGHVCTAIKLTAPAAGDYILYKGSRYTVCDPTYINAVAGMTLPRYKSTTPKVIEYN